MKALTRYSLAIALVLALSFVGLEARADSPGQMIDEKNAEQDLSIEGLKSEDARIESELAAEAALNAAQSDSLKSLSASVNSLEARVKALEEAGPVEPPVDTWPLFLRNLDTGVLTAIHDGAVTVPAGRYTVQIGESETEEIVGVPPFRSTVNDIACGPEQYPVYHICGNDIALALNEGDNAVIITAEGVGETKAVTILIEAAPPTGPPGDLAAKLQVGPWFPITSNIEEPFANAIRASRVVWEGGGLDTPAMLSGGYLNPETGLPRRLPNGEAIMAEVYFPANSPEMGRHWDGEWVLEWEGDADITLEYQPKELMRRVATNRVEFTRDYEGGRTPDHIRPRITRLDSPLTALRMFRKENEAALKAGKLYNPKFIDALSGYDIVRVMDLQSANGAIIRSVDDLASMAAPYWGVSEWSNATGEPQFKGPPSFQGMPIEGALRLGVECDCEIWFQAPLTLGAPEPFWNFRPADDRPDKWAAAFADSVVPVAVQVLESQEWDRYADRFVEALIKSGYPADRPLYVSLANEVWNFSGHYFLTTTYAQRMGTGLQGYLPGFAQNDARRAYGAMLARLKLALDGALERAGREQRLEIVVEGQAAYIELTGLALQGAKAYMEKHNETWADHAPGFGVSVASYWGYNDQLDQTGVDYNDLAALENLLLNGSENILGTKANVIKLFEGAQDQGARYGVKLIGAYEGGPHFLKPGAMSREKYQEFVWGEHGGRVNYEINKALAEEFPGIILSNYALAGTPGGQPWFEGPLAADNPYARSWKKLMALDPGAE